MDYFDDYIKALKKLNAAIDESIKLQERVLRNFKPSQKLELEDHNFRIDSVGWTLYKQGDIVYAQNPQDDVWEYIRVPEHRELEGEQLFTWNAAMRETEKAMKRMPTDEEFTELLKTKADMPNVLFAGLRNTDGSFRDLGTYDDFWSSTEAGSNAWHRLLLSCQTGVYRHDASQASGFSVRCLKSS